ncbi:MAG TPA: diacylglycerol kinase [Clostridiales bacterium UBA8153]|nr:diacylglycerol kinase [Clostridiales bacterium UBA8153]
MGKAAGSTGPSYRPHGLTGSLASAWRGLRQAWLAERNLRIHAVFAWIVLAVAQLLRVSRLEFLILVIAVVLVIAAELANTALELVTNLAAGGHRPMAGATKNIAAAMVLVTAAGASVVGLGVFWPYLPQLPALTLSGLRSRPPVVLLHGAGILTLALAGLLVPRRRF